MEYFEISINDILLNELGKYNIKYVRKSNKCEYCKKDSPNIPIPIDLKLPNDIVAYGSCCSFPCIDKFCMKQKFCKVNKYWNSIDIIFSILPIVL